MLSLFLHAEFFQLRFTSLSDFSFISQARPDPLGILYFKDLVLFLYLIHVSNCACDDKIVCSPPYYCNQHSSGLMSVLIHRYLPIAQLWTHGKLWRLTTGPLHRQTYSSCNSAHKTRTNSSQTKSQHGDGEGVKMGMKPHPWVRTYWQWIAVE